MFQLVIAEKPSVARDLARLLGARSRCNGFLEGNGFRVSWALGHLVRYAEPSEYGDHWRGRWSLKTLPMVPDTWKLRTEKKTAKQFRILKQLLNDHTTTSIICATDAGREGEHIFRLIYRHARCRKPVQRLWVSSLTDTAIREGLRRLQPGTAFDDLAQAAEARAKADWLVGLNLTRAYTVRHKTLCTIGRVQTPTLAMIVKRERSIRDFVKSVYYEISAQLEAGFEAKLTDGKEVARFEKREEAQSMVSRLNGQSPAIVEKIETKRHKRRPPPLYDLTNLQRDANRRFGMTAATTLKHAQALYETYKLISYPRTETHHIGEDMLPKLPRILENMDHPCAAEALNRLQGGLRLSKFYVDRTKLSDHHGILPTGKKAPTNLPAPLARVYSLIVARFIGIFLPDYEEDRTRLWLQLGGESFLAMGKTLVALGWRKVDPPRKKDREENELPACQPGDSLVVISVQSQEKETKPPSRFTDATLLQAMKGAGRELDDEALARAVREAGLGTPATRAEIIEKLIRTHLVRREKKALTPTEKGEALVDVVSPELCSVELTARWEQRLKDIESGKGGRPDFLSDIEALLNAILPGVKQSPDMQLSDEARAKDKKPYSGVGAKVETTCPSCEKGDIITGKKAFFCSHYKEGCSFTIWKTVAGKTLSVPLVKSLIRSGITPLIKGFKSKSGKRFQARLQLLQDGKVAFVFQDRGGDAQHQQGKPEPTRAKSPQDEQKRKAPKDLGQTISENPCPKCGKGRIIKGFRGFGCNRFREGCDWVLPKVILGKEVQKRTVVSMLEKGRTGWLKGFQPEEGASFEGRLCIAPGGLTVVMDRDGHHHKI